MISLIAGWAGQKLLPYALVAGALFLMVAAYGESRYKVGVRDATAGFVAADNKGAKDIHATAEKTLRAIGNDPDIDRLLRETGGLRE